MGTLDPILSGDNLDAASRARLRIRDRVLAGGCLLFGAGNNGRQLARRLLSDPRSPAVHGFISDRPEDQARQIEGLRVYSREQAAMAGFGAEAIVVNCVYRADVTIGAVLAGLRRSGFSEPLSLPDLYCAFPDILPSIYGYGPPELFRDSAGRIAEAFALLADEPSRRVFRELLQQRLSLDFSVPRPVDPAIYFPALIDRDRLAGKGPFAFVDCGAYNGDTVTAFAAWHRGPDAHVVAIEPDSASFAALEQIAATIRPRGIAVSCVNAAVGETSGRIGFQSLNNEASHIARDAETTVAMVSVDAVLTELGLAANLVKYDVEGFEREAIAGTRDAISRGSALAVSVYHKPDDLWDIPLLLRAMQPGYTFYLREHGPDGVDTVLYALPKQ